MWNRITEIFDDPNDENFISLYFGVATIVFFIGGILIKSDPMLIISFFALSIVQTKESQNEIME